MKVLMLAWGNPSRGDDAVGPWFAECFARRQSDGFKLLEAFQLQIEHLLDCRENQLLLFVDATADPCDDFRFSEIEPITQVSHTSHALAPTELLHHYTGVFHEPPPPAFQLAVPGTDFELGRAMSVATLQCCQRAAEFVADLLRRPDPEHWRQQVSEIEIL